MRTKLRTIYKTAIGLAIIIVFFFGSFSYFPLITQNAVASTFEMQTGYYIGTGSSLSISGLGFEPDLVIIKSSTATGSAFKTSAMPSNTMAFLSNTADSTSSQIAINSDGFTVETNTSINSSNTLYYYIAFTGSDCSSSGTFCVGEYTGDGSSPRTITTGFQPNLVVTKRSSTAFGHFRVTAHPTDNASPLSGTSEDTTGQTIKSFSSTGFVVGDTNNANTALYHFFAFKNTANAFSEGSYSGDGTDNRSITGVGFSPDWVFVKNSTTAMNQSRNSVMLLRESYGDNSSYTSFGNANTTNAIQALESDGFQVGTLPNANDNGATIYYAAFAGIPTPSASGTFDMASGSYTGTGGSLSITGLSFAPDLVLIKDNAAQYSVFRTKLMIGDITAYTSSPITDFTGGITSLTSDGFTVGTNTIVNTGGNTYHWQAFGNAYNPYTNSGADDFAIGAYLGNGIDNRNITRVPFSPNLITVKGAIGQRSVWRSSEQSGDISGFFSANPETANLIQSINSDGFQIGTISSVNSADALYRWFAFKSGENFTVGTYTGNGSTQNISGVGFQPDWIFSKSTTSSAGAHRPSSLSGATTQYFSNNANFSNGIVNLISNGISLGTSSLVNNSGDTYHFSAWNAKKYDQRVYRIFENDDSTDVGTPLANTDSAATLSADGQEFRLRMLIRVDNGNLYTDGQEFKLQFAEQSGECDVDFSGETYSDVTDSTDIAYFNNSTPSDNTALTANASDPTDGGRTIINQSYEELNTFTNSQNAIQSSGETGKWDFSLVDFSAPEGSVYCFRIVKLNGSELDAYTVIPQVTTSGAPPTEASITFSISDTSIGFGTLSSAVSRYATGDNLGSTGEAIAHTVTANTNASDGYRISITGSTLAYGIHTITAIGDNHMPANPGNEQFGLRITANGGNGSVVSPYNHASNYAYGATEFISDEVAIDTDGDYVSTTYSLRYLGNISAVTAAGQYTSTLTFIATGGF